MADESTEFRDGILKTREILNKEHVDVWDLAVLLETSYDSDVYRSWGFDSFHEYVEKELNIGIRKAQHLIQLQEWFKKMPGNIQQWMRSLGVTKARMLMHVVTVENAAEWRANVNGRSVVEIDKMIKESRGILVDSDEKKKKMGLSLYPDQYKNVERALATAMDVCGTRSRENAFDLICTEYLAMNAGIDSVQEVLRKMERSLGVRLVAYVEEDDSVAYGVELIKELESRDANGDS